MFAFEANDSAGETNSSIVSYTHALQFFLINFYRKVLFAAILSFETETNLLNSLIAVSMLSACGVGGSGSKSDLADSRTEIAPVTLKVFPDVIVTDEDYKKLFAEPETAGRGRSTIVAVSSTIVWEE